MRLPRKKGLLDPCSAYERGAGELGMMTSGMTKRLALSDGRDGGVKNAPRDNRDPGKKSR